jgi:tetratricopeptide (TPR) repeat protein
MKFPRTFRIFALSVLILPSLPTFVSADVLADARALLQQQQYAKVEETLAPLLEQANPPVEVLSLSYSAARASGRVFTAERRVRELIEREGDNNPRWIYEGAMVARDLGQEARMLDRLMFFVRQQKTKSPELEIALQTLVLRGSNPEAFRMYHAQYGAGAANASLGLGMLRRIRAEGQAGPLLDMAETLVTRLEDEADVAAVQWEMYEALNNNLFGLQRDAVYRALFAGKVKGFSVVGEMLSRLNINVEEMFLLQKAAGRPLPAEWMSRFEGLQRVESPVLRQQMAREYLALEPMYRSQGTPGQYRAYLWTLFRQPTVFIPDAGRVITEEQAGGFFKVAAEQEGGKNQTGLQGMGRLLLTGHNGTARKFVEKAELRNALLTNLPNAFRGEELVDLIADKSRDPQAVEGLIRRFPERQDLRMRLLENMNAARLGTLLGETVRREMIANPRNFPVQTLAREFLNSPALDLPAKIAILKAVYDETGNTRGLRELLQHRDSQVRNDPAMQAFAASLKDDARAKDPLLQILLSLPSENALRQGRDPKNEVTALVEQAIAAYGKPYPDATVSALRTGYMDEIVRLYRRACEDSGTGRREFARVVAPALSAAADWEDLVRFSIRDNNWDGFTASLIAKSALRAGAPFLSDFGLAQFPANEAAPILAPHYAKMDPHSLRVHLSRNRGVWTPTVLAEQLGKALEAKNLTEGDLRPLNEVLTTLRDNAKAVEGPLPMDALLSQFFVPNAQGQLRSNWETRREILRFLTTAGKGVETFQRLAKNLAAHPNTLLEALFWERDYAPFEGFESAPKPGHLKHLLLVEFLPRFRGLSDVEQVSAWHSVNVYRHIQWVLGKRELPDDQRKLYEELLVRLIRARAKGARGDNEWGDMQNGLQMALRDAVSRNDVDTALELIRFAGTMGAALREGEARALVQPLQEKEWMEPLLLLTQVLKEGDPAARAVINQARALASSRVPGIYPVEKNDPVYPLYQAADELSQNNPERAWTLLRQNLALFAANPLRYPPDFTGWALERLREVKGDDGALLDQSMELSHLILSKSAEITPELAARVMLNRAEIHRLQKNFDAARLEYQSIRSNPDYQKTAFGRLAMFRDVDLMIQMGNTTAAEGLLEYWLSNPDPELQAKAYYFQALIAYNNGDDALTRENLDKVFALDLTHSEGRLLHGRWRLRTNYEVDNPEVLLGTLLDRTILRPGQPLRISVQDQNLSIVGGGSAIPVIVRSSAGGDEERINLFPSTRDPKLFRGAIDTRLAVAAKNSQLLEVNGLDVVSYEIDPVFLKERGMSSSPPKELRIVDDARLAVSAGMILSEAEQQSREIARQMAGDTQRVTEGGGNVRPGNPLYVMVRDRDRSSGKNDGQVMVQVETSSGDRLSGFVLREIEPFSGEFRGEIPTALPPPRASASDSAEGTNPGDVINRTRNGLWRSRSDGVQGKWIKADTMDSQLIKRAELKTPDAARIAEMRLWGNLAGEEVLLGSFPPRSVPGGGVQLRTTRQNLRSLVEYREVFGRMTDLPISLADFRYESKQDDSRIHLRGAFWLPEARDLRLQFLPLFPENSSAMNDAWLTLLVNGETVASGRGSDLARQASLVPLTRGGHVVEVFGYVKQARDGFALGVEEAGGEVKPIPAEWFDLAKNPDLADFLKDRARLTRRDDAWTADFPEPQRLRALRWEFVRYAGDSLSASEFRIEDENNKPVLPAGSDFTDALGNAMLEIAPGDRITVTYSDDVTTEGQRKLLSQELRSQFTNGTIGFYFEQLTPGPRGMERQLFGAYRFRPGDDFLVMVQDGDLDKGPGADTVDVELSTRGGEKLVVKATEQAPENAAEGAAVHSGRFVALVRTRSEAGGGPDVLRVRPGDRIVASYLDRENTVPGIPVPRVAELDGVQPSEPVVTLFHTWREAREDSSEEAQRKLEQIRSRSGNLNINRILVWTSAAMPMAPQEAAAEIVPVNADSGFPIEIFLPSEAMHSGSFLTLRASAASSPEVTVEQRMGLGRARGGFQMRANPALAAPQTGALAETQSRNGDFGGLLHFRLGQDELADASAPASSVLSVQGNDRVSVQVLSPSGAVLFERQLQLVSEGSIALKDGTYQAERTRIHLGERFFVEVSDTDRDISPDHDTVTVNVRASKSGNSLDLTLRETLPHSGIFTGVLMPRFASPTATDTEEAAGDLVGIPTLGVGFGEEILFDYLDEVTLPIRTPGTRSVSGSIFDGSDGKLMAFTKYFPDADMAVRVQFRLAESLFEMAKDYRKLKQAERSSEAIAEGKRILEEALAGYPETALAVEGEYLLANLYQEMGAEVEQEQPEISRKHYQEALARFSALLSAYPDSAFAARAQYHKALSLEKLGDFKQAAEEYVKMIYIFPESPLVGEAAIRLATHYYRVEERFDTAGKIYANFHRRFASHPLAAKALFMSAQCHLKQGEVWEEERRGQGLPETQVKTERILDEYRRAVRSLQALIDDPAASADKEVRAQSLYWAGDASLRAMDYPAAYLFLKRTVLEYPESEWARRSRGMLLQSAKLFEGLE